MGGSWNMICFHFSSVLQARDEMYHYAGRGFRQQDRGGRDRNEFRLPGAMMVLDHPDDWLRPLVDDELITQDERMNWFSRTLDSSCRQQVWMIWRLGSSTQDHREKPTMETMATDLNSRDGVLGLRSHPIKTLPDRNQQVSCMLCQERDYLLWFSQEEEGFSHHLDSCLTWHHPLQCITI